MNKLECLVLTVKRHSIQAGIPNCRYPERYLYDSRLTHHIPTDAVEQWKGFKCAGNDSKFTDIVTPDGNFRAEGKSIKRDKGVILMPSIDVGGGRKFNNENLLACFSKNNFYFLYETVSHTEIDLIFHIYWIPVDIIKEWYIKYGMNGSIKYLTLMACIRMYTLEKTCINNL